MDEYLQKRYNYLKDKINTTGKINAHSNGNIQTHEDDHQPNI